MHPKEDKKQRMKKFMSIILVLAMSTLFLPCAYARTTTRKSDSLDDLLKNVKIPSGASNVTTRTWTDENGDSCVLIYYEETYSSDCWADSTPDYRSDPYTSADLARIMDWVEQQTNTEASEKTTRQKAYSGAVFQTAQPGAAYTYNCDVYQFAQPGDCYDPTVYQTAQPKAGNPCPTACPTARPTQAAASGQHTTLTQNPVSYSAPTAKPTARPTQAPAVSTGDYTTFDATMQEQILLNLVNQDRAKNGLAPLALDPELSDLARLKSNDMSANNYFAHESPTYGNAAQMLDAFNYDYKGLGENIAHYGSVEKAEAAFMSSEGHRRNILGSQWDKVGIGIVYDKDGHLYVTQLFAR